MSIRSTLLKHLLGPKHSNKNLKQLWESYKRYNPGSAAANLSVNNEEMINRKIVLESLPVIVNFGTTSRCNMNPPCVMCLRNVETRNQDLSWRALLRSGYIADSASTLMLHGVGEPLTYPHLFDIAKLASRDAITMFTTNGQLIERYVEEICGLIRKVSVSIDAATSQTYRKIRNNDLDRVKSGIRQVVAAKRARGQDSPSIDISMCLMRSNMNEAAQFVEMGAELKVDTVHFYHLNMGPEYVWRMGWFDYQEEHCHLEPDGHDEAVIEALKRAKELKVPVIFDGKPLFKKSFEFPFMDNPSGPPMPEDVPRCTMPWRNIQINSDGTVMNCCYQTVRIGNLEESPFVEIWNGECQKAVREGIISGNFHDYCRNAYCPVQGRL